MKTFLIVLTASLTLLVALTLSISLRPSMAAAQDLPYSFFSLITNCLGIRTTPKVSSITPMANPLPKRRMAPRSPSQVRVGGTRTAKPLRAVANIPSRTPRERSQNRDHGE